jgi:branched-subunit amino acid ABC-type transport system permease component
MWEAITDIFTSGDIWSIVIKVLITAALGGVVSLMGTVLAKLITKNKESKIYKYAKTLVDAAEQKFPNEGTKMGPQKMEYVMS